MKKQIQFRQGDLFIRRIGRLPKDLKETKDTVLALGEVTGHKHTLISPLKVMELSGGQKFFKSNGKTKLVHEEHQEIVFDEGTYEVVRQREYTPQAIRRVMD